MSDQEFDNIAPAEISLNSGSGKERQQPAGSPKLDGALGMEEIHQAELHLQKNQKILWGIFSLLLVLVVGVIFVLPEYISPPAPEQSLEISTSPASTRPGTQEISPFAEAQILSQREDAQEVLSELLALQDSLANKGADQWAADNYALALTQASEGDSFYQNQEFIEAEQSYMNSLLSLQAIELNMPEVLQEFIDNGFAAIIAGEALAAESAFSNALLIDPGNNEASEGLTRASNLTQVLALLDQGQAQMTENNYEEALSFFEQAVAIDRNHDDAKQLVIDARNAILDRDFSMAMSEGYAALQSDNPHEAETSFTEALVLRPESTEASTAIIQARDRITFKAVSEQLEKADNYVKQENWPEALATFEQALTLDPNVVAAKEGKAYSQSRANLDAFLEATNADPLRLAESEVYRQARNVFTQASQITDPEPRLQSQLGMLENFLRAAINEVEVQLKSDGITSVSVYRIAELGQFADTTLVLTPGHYVAVGVRDGFRDVRQEFTVTINGKAPVVDVRCTEKI